MYKMKLGVHTVYLCRLHTYRYVRRRQNKG